MSNLNNMGTPKFKAKLEFETEKCREEGKWQKVLQLTQQMINNNSDKSLIQFLLGESKLELYLDLVNSSMTSTTSASTKNLFENKEKLLEESEEHLKNCLNSSSSSPLCIDANLLLAKLCYAKKEYEKTIKYIEASGIENVTQIEKALPLRVMKLICESFAVKGMALEYLAESNQDTLSIKEQDSKLLSVKSSELISKNTIESRIFCLNKATDLTLRYLQNIEKQHGQYALISIGNIMETAIQRAPLLYIKNSQLDLALNQYRSILNAVECKATSNCRQIIARQLTEVIMRGVSRNCWKPFDLNSMASNTGLWRPHRYNGQTIFNPQQREEELLLTLLIAEQQAAANVVLERSCEFDKSRNESLNNVIAIYDLFTIAFTPLRYFAVDLFEKAMKFSFEVKHIWLQFGLTLLESRKSQRGLQHRSLQIFDEVSRMDKSDPLPLLIQAKIYLTDLLDPEASLVYSNQALETIKTKDGEKSDSLLPRCYLLIGIANALIYEKQNEFNKSQMKTNLEDSIKNFKMMANCSLHDHLAYYHLALSYANRRMINEAILNLQISLTLNPVHLPTVQLLIICLTSLKKYKEALMLCESALQEFPNQLLLLYIKANIQQNICEDGLQEALMTAKEMLNCCKLLSSNNQPTSLENPTQSKSSNSNTANQVSSNYHLTGLSCDTMSLRMEQTLSEVASIDSNLPMVVSNAIGAPVSSNTANEINQLDQTTTLINSHSGIALSQHSGSNISSNFGFSQSNSFQQQLANMQVQIWILVTELFIKLGQFEDAENCLIENCQQQIFGILSHQLMYIKGKLCIARNQLIEAKILLQSCISINPRHSNALQQLGLTYHLMGNHLSAEKYLRDSLNCDANCVETWSIMGSVLEKLGDSERAINCNLTALRLEETEPILPFNIVPRTVFE